MGLDEGEENGEVSCLGRGRRVERRMGSCWAAEEEEGEVEDEGGGGGGGRETAEGGA